MAAPTPSPEPESKNKGNFINFRSFVYLTTTGMILVILCCWGWDCMNLMMKKLGACKKKSNNIPKATRVPSAPPLAEVSERV